MIKNIRKDKFIAEYLKCFNGTRAAIAAGYSEKSARTTASKLKKDPYVLEKINEYKNDLNNEAIISLNGIFVFLSDVVNQKKTDEHYDSTSGQNVETKVSIKDSLKAAEYLLKYRYNQVDNDDNKFIINWNGKDITEELKDNNDIKED